MHVLIVIVNYNNALDTIRCLDSLARLRDENHDIVVVDNHSNVDDYEVLKNWIIANKNNKIFLERTKVNGGFASGCNYAINKYFSNKIGFVWLLNNDSIVDPLALRFILDEFIKDESLGVCGSAVYYPNGEIQSIGAVVNKITGVASPNKNIKNIVNIDYVVGCSMAIKSQCLDAVGLMDEKYFLYYEETDFCFRAKVKRWNVGIAIKSIVYHEEGGSTKLKKSADKPIYIDYLLSRNRIIFCKRWLPHPSAAILSVIFVAAKRLLVGKPSNCLSVLKGLRDGIKES